MKYIRTLVIRTLKGNGKQFELVGNSTYRGKFQWNLDQGKGNLVQVSREFKVIWVWVIEVLLYAYYHGLHNVVVGFYQFFHYYVVSHDMANQQVVVILTDFDIHLVKLTSELWSPYTGGGAI